MSSAAEIADLIVAKGEEIRLLKTSGAAKDALAPHVAELLQLKEKFKAANNGVSYDPPKVEVKKEKKALEEPAVQREGPSKKELNKIARKEGRAAATAAVKTEVAEGAPAPAIAPVAAASSTILPLGSFKVIFSKGHEAKFAKAIVGLIGDSPVFETSTAEAPHEPYLMSTEGSISGDVNIGRFIARVAAPALYFASNPWLSTQVDQWLSVLSSHTADVNAFLDILNAHLGDKTFLVASALSLADIAVYVFLLTHRNTINLGGAKDAERWVNAARWNALIFSSLSSSKKVPAGKGKEVVAKSSGGAKVSAAAPEDDMGGCPPLEDAVEGQVVTRFPPEPSGYLHIGHVKAVLLNQYYARRYKGKLIVRFDDTNPSKEKDEYEENIIRDLATLNVHGDIVTHTSDSFGICERFARQMIGEGLAYMDDTPQEQMQAERMEKIESKCRNTSPEVNLAIFEDLLLGKPEAIKYCMRAKIDMNSVNGTMRDPVMYRYNATPHHRTGTKYKAYPTYDFACPIVDSLEGVTHALRTTEYNDRDEQYKWIIKALRLRPVHIMTYGKISFVNCVLSKRKLNWFVEQKIVDGWFDPRFPTVQGCIRRGINVEALTSFILRQGASRRVITMEWDKFWSDNKKKLEEIAARYMSVGIEAAVPFIVTNVPEGETSASVQIHPQRPEMGNRVMRRSNRLLVERDDANTLKVGEEVTFLRWGNFIIDSIENDIEGKNVISMSGRYNPDATNFSKTKKVTWLADSADNVPCALVEFDHLISKAKILDEEDFKDFLTPVTRAETMAYGDACIRNVNAGDVIQFERKGFFRCDKPYGNAPDKPAVFFLIPDGKTRAMSTLTSALSHR